MVQAYLGGSEPPIFPLGLGYIAASVKEHTLEVFDPNVSKNPFEEFTGILSRLVPDVVGISIRNIDSTNKRRVVFYYDFIKELICLVKNVQGDQTKIIVGGSGFSMFPQQIMEDEPRIDFGVFLEGEETFRELLHNLDRPEAVKGIYYRWNDEICFSGERAKPNVNTLPFAKRDGLSIRKYKEIPDAIGVETKRGCELNCAYCIYGFLNGKKYRLRDPKRVVDEIEAMVKDFNVSDFMFVDSIFNVPPSHAESICREMIRRELQVSWSAWFHDAYITDEYVDLIKKAGCIKVMLSPDALSDEILLQLKKSQRKQDILRTYRILKQSDGMEICYNFFKNPPGQSLKAFFNLLFFCIKAKYELGKRIHFEFNSIRIEPHTRLYEMALREGLIHKNESLLYPKYYTNTATSYIDTVFNALLRLKGA
ncbi:MAG: radical SAM protein [Thermodesulfobacteriota bacterium]|nr:radical SAM protein [Thermodesulfobacteriota bacterium]